MLAELDALFRLGWRGMVFIVDDNFIGNKRNVKKLLPALADWSERHGRPFSFIAEASVNLAEDEELLDGMRRAHFRRVFLGIETPVKASLKEAQKGQNMRRNLLDSVKKIQSYGMEVMAGFIVGFDNDPDDIFERQIEFIREIAIPLAMVGLLKALPDTQLWRRLEREGRLLLESTGNNTDCSLNFVPKMDATRLIEGYKSIMRAIYSPGEYYQRALDCLERVVATAPAARRNGIASDVVTLFRIALTGLWLLIKKFDDLFLFFVIKGRFSAAARMVVNRAILLPAIKPLGNGVSVNIKDLGDLVNRESPLAQKNGVCANTDRMRRMRLERRDEILSFLRCQRRNKSGRGFHATFIQSA